MQDMFGLAILFELSQRNGPRKHDFNRQGGYTPLRAWLYRFGQSFHARGTAKGPE